MTVNCCWLLPNFELYCTKLILRIIPRIRDPITFQQVSLINQCWVRLRGGSGQPDERNSSSAHTVKEQHAPEEHREVASLNTDNEFNRAINEEDIDFNIPRVLQYTVKQLQSASVSRIDSENREPPEPTCSSTRPPTKSTI